MLLIIGLPFVFSAIDDGLTEDYTQSISGVATASGNYSANVTLSRSIYNDETTSVSAISSNVSDDSPTAYTYNSVSRVLEVSGLSDNDTRTLSVEFLIDSTTLPTGCGTILTLIRWFWVFAILGMVCGAIYAFFD